MKKDSNAISVFVSPLAGLVSKQEKIMTTKNVNLNLKISDFLDVSNLLTELPEIVKQLEFCKYECQGGKLEMNTSFIRLKEILVELASGLTKRRVNGCQCMRVPRENGTLTVYVNPYCAEHGVRR